MNRILSITALCTLAACATPQTSAPTVATGALEIEALNQKRFVIDQRLEERARVARTYLSISRANIDFCKNRSRSIGVELHSLGRYGKSFKDAALAVGLTDAPTIGVVAIGSPAESAGLQKGDIVLAVDGKPIAATLAGVRAVERKIADWKSESAIPLSLKRGDLKFDVNVTSEEICGFPVQIAESDELNAFADGKSVVLQRGMLRFFANDNEMALVLGHELAHNALGHIDAQKQNAAVGMAGGLVLDVLLAATTGYASDTFTRAGGQVGAMAYSADFETEADYAGMYFIARAGFSLDNVENFWRRIAVEAPSAIKVASTHPTTPQRFLTLAATRDEIQSKRLAGLELKPRLKADGHADTTALASVKPATESAPVMAEANSAPLAVDKAAPASSQQQVNPPAPTSTPAPEAKPPVLVADAKPVDLPTKSEAGPATQSTATQVAIVPVTP